MLAPRRTLRGHLRRLSIGAPCRPFGQRRTPSTLLGPTQRSSRTTRQGLLQPLRGLGSLIALSLPRAVSDALTLGTGRDEVGRRRALTMGASLCYVNCTKVLGLEGPPVTIPALDRQANG